MKKTFFIGTAMLSMALLLTECKTKSAATTNAPKETTTPAPVNPDAADISAGMLIFNSKCDRCHKQPNEKAHNDAAWKVTMEKMSMKAHLTETETAQVLKYLATADK